MLHALMSLTYAKIVALCVPLTPIFSFIASKQMVAIPTGMSLVIPTLNQLQQYSIFFLVSILLLVCQCAS